MLSGFAFYRVLLGETTVLTVKLLIAPKDKLWANSARMREKEGNKLSVIRKKMPNYVEFYI